MALATLALATLALATLLNTSLNHQRLRALSQAQECIHAPAKQAYAIKLIEQAILHSSQYLPSKY